MEQNGKKVFNIPNQIDSGFHVWRFVTLWDLVFLLPIGAVSFFVYKLVEDFPNTQLRFFLTFLPLVLGGALLFIRPLRERKNVRLFEVLKWRFDYGRRQRLFYFKKMNWMRGGKHEYE